MHYAIIVSEHDPAGVNIFNCILKKYPFNKDNTSHSLLTARKNAVTLHMLGVHTIDANHIEKQIDADFFIFATRHQSKEGVLSLSCHAPGNWSTAGYGGVDRQLSMTSAAMLKKAFLILKRRAPELPGYEATLEATHHGPMIEKPAMFIEIGSSEKEWTDQKAGMIIAETLLELIDSEPSAKQRCCIGLGGTHYCASFNKILERTDFSISHMCPKYALASLGRSMIEQAISKTLEEVDGVLLDWKGLGSEKERILSLLTSMNLQVFRTDQLLK